MMQASKLPTTAYVLIKKTSACLLFLFISFILYLSI